MDHYVTGRIQEKVTKGRMQEKVVSVRWKSLSLKKRLNHSSKYHNIYPNLGIYLVPIFCRNM